MKFVYQILKVVNTHFFLFKVHVSNNIEVCITLIVNLCRCFCVSVYLGLQPIFLFNLPSFEVGFSFLDKISHQSLVFVSLLKKNNNNKASKCTDEVTVRRSALDKAISLKWTYHGESVGLVLEIIVAP